MASRPTSPSPTRATPTTTTGATATKTGKQTQRQKEKKGRAATQDPGHFAARKLTKRNLFVLRWILLVALAVVFYLASRSAGDLNSITKTFCLPTLMGLWTIYGHRAFLSAIFHTEGLALHFLELVLLRLFCRIVAFTLRLIHGQCFPVLVRSQDHYRDILRSCTRNDDFNALCCFAMTGGRKPWGAKYLSHVGFINFPEYLVQHTFHDVLIERYLANINQNGYLNRQRVQYGTDVNAVGFLKQINWLPPESDQTFNLKNDDKPDVMIYDGNTETLYIMDVKTGRKEEPYKELKNKLQNHLKTSTHPAAIVNLGYVFCPIADVKESITLSGAHPTDISDTIQIPTSLATEYRFWVGTNPNTNAGREGVGKHGLYIVFILVLWVTDTISNWGLLFGCPFTPLLG